MIVVTAVLNLAAQRHGSWWVLVVSGDLDVATAPRLVDYLAGASWADPPPRIALELSGLRFCDAAGLRAFVDGWERAASLGGSLVLVAPPPRVVKFLGIFRADHITIADAVTDLPQ
ncbi:STAS domain-containing protein [Actinomadura luteofluorescens]|uniref:STAS domain-containing protein n=1 Tax=Actinomadura luteofluorescens TaxID=46163 RepID=UPI00348B96B1